MHGGTDYVETDRIFKPLLARHAAMRRPSRFFIETTGTFVAVLCVAFVLENPPGLSHGAEGREMVMSAPAIEVNRALKGDRLIVRPNAGEPPGAQVPRNPTQHFRMAANPRPVRSFLQPSHLGA